MATPEQNKANVQNSEKSTGPRTEEGKARSSRNASTHGLTAKALLPWEDATAYEAFEDTLLQELGPRGMLETILAGRVVQTAWIISQRLPNADAGIFLAQLYQQWRPVDKMDDVTKVRSTMGRLMADIGEGFSQLSRYRASLEKGFFRNLHELQRLQADRKRGSGVPPIPADGTGDGGN